MTAVPISDTDYPAVRRVMGDDRLRLDDYTLESVLEQLFPDTDPVDVESFMGAVQRFGREVAPIAQRALPGAVQGAVAGGPYGAIAGGALGAMSPTPRAAPAQPKAAPAQPNAAPASPAIAPAAPYPQAAPVATASTSPQAAAASALLEVISNPATLEALMAVLMQTAGRSVIKVGAQQVPPAAFTNAIAEFAALATADETATEPVSDYLYGDSGWPRGDIANPVERATILLNDLRDAVRAQESPISAYERIAYGWRTYD